MFRIIIFLIILTIIFVGAYKFMVNMLNSRIERRLFKQHNPNKVWHSIYKPIGIILACIFAIISNFLLFDAQYLLAFISLLGVGGSIWLFKKC